MLIASSTQMLCGDSNRTTIPRTVRPATAHRMWVAVTGRGRSSHMLASGAGRARSMVTVPTDIVSAVMAANVTSAIERAS